MPRKSTQSATVDPIDAELAVFDQAQKTAATKKNPVGGRTLSGKFDPTQAAAAYRLIRKAYPDLTPNKAAVEAAGMGADGQSQIMYCVSREKGPGLPAARVILWRSGKANFVNVPVIALPQ